MREDRLRKAAKERRTLFNAWLTLNNPFLIELIGEAGWDCITIDQQHGLGGNEALLGCLTAARACGLPAIVRVAENSPGLIGRALDAGAQGIMCPLIGSVEDAEAFVQAVKYPAARQSELGSLPGPARSSRATISRSPMTGPSPVLRSRPGARSTSSTRFSRSTASTWFASARTIFRWP